MDWHQALPPDGAVTKEEIEEAFEVRLRCGYPLQLISPRGIRKGSFPLTQEHIRLALLALCGHSISHREEALSQGFLPLPGGHRLGVCGERSNHLLLAPSSLCIRIARPIPHAAKDIFPLIRGKNVLILGPPGSGKTTLLRDLVRRTAGEMQVSVVDTRGEIAACFQGTPQMDVGPMCDVMTGGRKDEMMIMMLRSMCPQMMATDELGTEEEALAVMEISRCGVGVMATAHARDAEDAKSRKGLSLLMENRIFSHCILLSHPLAPARVVAL